jgi:hypothetical protein
MILAMQFVATFCSRDMVGQKSPLHSLASGQKRVMAFSSHLITTVTRAPTGRREKDAARTPSGILYRLTPSVYFVATHVGLAVATCAFTLSRV